MIAKLIEAWFREHDGDGDFVCRESGTPYTVIGANQNRGSTIFTTKPQSVIALIGDRQIHKSGGLIGGYGLPDRADLSLLRRILGRRSLMFVGDLDPVDLMVFAWLRDQLEKTHVSYIGVSDALLREARIAVHDCHQIPHGRFERKAMRLLSDLLPDLEKIIGIDCARILKNKSKLELEAVLQLNRAGAAVLALSFGRRK